MNQLKSWSPKQHNVIYVTSRFNCLIMITFSHAMNEWTKTKRKIDRLETLTGWLVLFQNSLLQFRNDVTRSFYSVEECVYCAIVSIRSMYLHQLWHPILRKQQSAASLSERIEKIRDPCTISLYTKCLTLDRICSSYWRWCQLLRPAEYRWIHC